MRLRQALKIVRAFNREGTRAYRQGRTPHHRHTMYQWAMATFRVNRMRSLHLPFMAHFEDGTPDRMATVGGMCNENIQRMMRERGLKERTKGIIIDNIEMSHGDE